MILLDIIKFINDEAEKYFSKIKEQSSLYDAVVIYGAGSCGKKLYSELKMRQINISNFCVTKNNVNRTKIDGLDVYSLDEIIQSKRKVLYLLAVLEISMQDDLKTELVNRGISSYIKMPRIIQSMFRPMYKQRYLEITTKVGCSVNCKYCPQNKFLKAYHGQMEMSIDDFKTCVDKLPSDLMIVFSGFVEPFLAKDTVQMIQYANNQGRKIFLNTTLVGMTKSKFDQVKNIPFERVILHLPDKNNYAHIPTTEEYFELLQYIITTKKVDGKCFIDKANSQYEPNERAYNIVKNYVDVDWVIHDRAGNLSYDELKNQECKHKRQLTTILRCETSMTLSQNILLPNGDVVLCCNDFGLQHVLGNLKIETYEDIKNSNEMKHIVDVMNGNVGEILCQKCHWAIRFDNEDNV